MLKDEWEFLQAALQVLDPIHYAKHFEELVCPYCRGLLQDPAEVTPCTECGTLHHLSCWQEYGHCSGQHEENQQQNDKHLHGS